MKPKELMAVVRQKHPEASKKEIVRAAFYALTDDTARQPDGSATLQALAIEERAFSDEEAAPSASPRNKLKSRKSRQKAKDGDAARA
ncbi:hypothetical protein BK022_00125 [Methylorubrum extorquens]|uniref:Uncharacterized protein n=1 Tax=Methylorubrum extorquens TaxID=408 RepID=A0A1S1PAJ2_METEX|nr:hypothetical protein BK022_00125 [Methylorubrum extorquens]